MAGGVGAGRLRRGVIQRGGKALLLVGVHGAERPCQAARGIRRASPRRGAQRTTAHGLPLHVTALHLFFFLSSSPQNSAAQIRWEDRAATFPAGTRSVAVEFTTREILSPLRQILSCWPHRNALVATTAVATLRRSYRSATWTAVPRVRNLPRATAHEKMAVNLVAARRPKLRGSCAGRDPRHRRPGLAGSSSRPTCHWPRPNSSIG